MKHKLLVNLLVVGLLLGLLACSAPPPAPPASSPPPAASPTVPAPAPRPTLAPSPSPGPTLTAAPSPKPTAPPTTAPPPKPAAPAEVSITSNRAMVDFPNKITFAVEGTSALPVKTLSLEYSTDRRSVVSEVSRVEPQYGKDVKISASWAWEMKKTYSIPPAARIWWQWRIGDDAGRSYVVPRQTLVWEDTRYQWNVESGTTMDIYWHGQESSLIKALTTGIESKLARVKLAVDIPKERKPRIMVYVTSEQIRGAVLFSQEWTGALAYPDYNIILTAVNRSNLEWAKGTLAHEITHLMVGEAVFGPFGDVPLWLNEGLAEYAEGEMTEAYRKILDAAAKGGKLISVRSLGSGFPTDSQQAYLAYAQSNSLVTYLVNTHGWEKIRQLLAVFKEGSTYDNALKKVYGFDTAGLEKEWRAKIGAAAA